MVSGLFTTIVMNPFDIVATRMFNQGKLMNWPKNSSQIPANLYSTGVNSQGKGLLYKNVIDCFIKTVRVEGFWALYKGFLVNYMRLAPHTILNLTFWEQFKRWKELYYEPVLNFE